MHLEIDVDTVIHRRLSILGPPSKTAASFVRSVEALNSGRLPLDVLTTAAYPLDRTLEAIQTLTSVDSQRPFHVRVEPQA